MNNAKNLKNAFRDCALWVLKRAAKIMGQEVHPAGAYDSLLQKAATDPLTGLYNRTGAQIAVKELVAALKRRDHGKEDVDTHLVVMVLDIDHFKNVNDRYGHDAGDVVLRGVADTLKESLRAEDILCRSGGEEMIVIAEMPTVSGVAVPKIASKLREVVGAARHTLSDGQEIGVTVSCGVTTLPLNVITADDIVTMFDAKGGSSLQVAVKRADNGVYAAKENGRNRIQFVPYVSAERPAAANQNAQGATPNSGVA